MAMTGRSTSSSDVFHDERSSDRDGRISLPGVQDMSAEQKAIYHDVVNGPRGRLVGPLRAVIHSPELADRWQKLGEFVRFRTVLPEELKELVILVTARRWNSELEWAVHREIASKAGLPDAVIDAIRDGEVPTFENEPQREIYRFCRDLQMQGQVGDGAYRPVMQRWGEQGIVELTAIVGYYTMVAMMLNAHRVPLPEGKEPDLTVATRDLDQLSVLAPAETATD